MIVTDPLFFFCKYDLIYKKRLLPLKHLENINLLCTQPYIFQWMFTKLYLSLKTIDNLNANFVNILLKNCLQTCKCI